MKTSSPLRYPGGKSAMSGLLREIRRLNGLGKTAIAEPFAGGAGASLELLFLEDTHEILINDADCAIHDFWWSLVNRPRQFQKLLSKTRVSMAEWRRQREAYRRRSSLSRLKSGFSAFYLNRCNRSGIIKDGGPIGGVKQAGEWKLNARFNKSELARRCAKIAEYRDRIRVTSQDGIQFIEQRKGEDILFFIDPPYFAKGKMLYMDLTDDKYHSSLAEQLRTMRDRPWVLTYDDCPTIRRLYKGWATVRPFALRYAAAERRRGKEVLIAPKWLSLPRSQPSDAITW